MGKRFLLSVIVSVIILVFLFLNFLEFKEFLDAMLSVNFLLFLASDIPYVIQALLMGYRLSWAMNKSGAKTSLTDGFIAHLFGMLGSDFSVGRFGYLASSLPLKSKLAGNLGVVSTLVVVDVIAKAIFSIISALFFICFLRLEISPFLFAFAALIIFIGILFFAIAKSPKLMIFISKIPIIGRRILPYYQDFRSSLESLKSGLFFLFIFPVLGWILRGCEWIILGYAVGIYFPFHVWLMLHPILSLTRLIPITAAGLGIFELTFIALFPNLEPAKQVTFGLLDMVNNSLVDIFGLLSIWKTKEIK
ncbi:MAG: lysylphosphatidylglycerol synthase domain-containing protein [Candidatus Bathyarchaeia archaeon]